MSSPEAVLAVARSQLGVVERPRGSDRTTYGAWYGLDGNAWCDMFVSWCGAQAGAGGSVGRFAYTPSHALWFSGRGQWGSTPRLGAVVFFAFSAGDPARWLGISHVGIVEQVRSDGSVVTIEGNTDASEGRTGGCVMRKVRRAQIAGYGYPAYALVPEDLVTATQRALHLRTDLGEVDGVWGPQTDRGVDTVRAALNGGFPWGVPEAQTRIGTASDGDWGPLSHAALRDTVARLQAAWGTGVDGEWGPLTEAAWLAARQGHLVGT